MMKYKVTTKSKTTEVATMAKQSLILFESFFSTATTFVDESNGAVKKRSKREV